LGGVLSKKLELIKMFVVRVQLQGIRDRKVKHQIFFNEVPSPSRITEEFESHIKVHEEHVQDSFRRAWGDLSRLDWSALVVGSSLIAQGWAVSDKVYAIVEQVEIKPGKHMYISGRCCP